MALSPDPLAALISELERALPDAAGWNDLPPYEAVMEYTDYILYGLDDPRPMKSAGMVEYERYMERQRQRSPIAGATPTAEPQA